MSVEKPLPASPGATKQNSQHETPGIQTQLGSNYGFYEADQPSQPPRRVSSHRSMDRMQSLSSLRSASISKPHTSKPVPSLPPTPLQQTFTSSPDADLEHGPDEPQPEEETAWGPTHPCFPHLNPHVPLHSPAYHVTRVIRVKRDWMIIGDLAPTYSNIYPEILDPILPEQEFRYIIDHVNSTLMQAYDPYSTANWIDGVLGFLTGWFWEDLRGGSIKAELKKLEKWIEEWNRTVGASDGVKIISLRRTGYMSIDIQIPDPQVRLVESREGREYAESSATPRPPTTAR